MAAATPDWQPKTPEPSGIYVTPVIRKLAADRGVDLAIVTGSGVGGRIRREDVIAAAEAAEAARQAAENARRTAAPAPAPASQAATPAAATPAASGAAKPDAVAAALIGTTAKLPRIRQSIARNMKYGLDTAAQLTTVIEVDVTRVAALRARAKTGVRGQQGVKLSFLPFFVKAAIEGLKLYPVVNSSLSEDLKEITYHAKVQPGHRRRHPARADRAGRSRMPTI